MSRISIVGLGAIGSNLAMNLIADYKKDSFHIWDHGKIESRNLQAYTQAYFKEQLDMPKASALRINLYNLFNVEVKAFNHHISESWILVKAGNVSNYDLIIDCLDNYEGRKVLFDYAKKFKIACLHIGFSPQLTFEICWNESYEVPQDAKGLDICTLQGASSFVKYVSALASNVIQDFLRNGKKRNLIGNRFSIREIS